MSDCPRRYDPHQRPDHSLCLFVHFTNPSFAPTKIYQLAFYHILLILLFQHAAHLRHFNINREEAMRGIAILREDLGQNPELSLPQRTARCGHNVVGSNVARSGELNVMRETVTPI